MVQRQSGAAQGGVDPDSAIRDQDFSLFGDIHHADPVLGSAVIVTNVSKAFERKGFPSWKLHSVPDFQGNRPFLPFGIAHERSDDKHEQPDMQDIRTMPPRTLFPQFAREP
ncbi:MAG: hypothetical protein A2Y36_10940 [Treponema sp. GWA1_62_8]|nr:MAG: hypothetical protein A2Y36_10940 [Treponema sp. GWA1_62_8]